MSLFVCFFNYNAKYSYAKSSTDIEKEYNNAIENTLEDINYGELNDFLSNDIFINLFDIVSFKDFVILVLNGEIFINQDVISSVLIDNIKLYL